MGARESQNENSGQNLGFLVKFGSLSRDLGHFAMIQAIMLGYGPFYLDLGY